jgi:hypothetical protein
MVMMVMVMMIKRNQKEGEADHATAQSDHAARPHLASLSAKASWLRLPSGWRPWGDASVSAKRREAWRAAYHTTGQGDQRQGSDEEGWA